MSKFETGKVGEFIHNIHINNNNNDHLKAEETVVKVDELRHRNLSHHQLNENEERLWDLVKLENIISQDSSKWAWIAKTGQQIETVNDKLKGKSNKFFSKPVVITEPGRKHTSSIYYRQLRDNFGDNRNRNMSENDCKIASTKLFNFDSNSNGLPKNVGLHLVFQKTNYQRSGLTFELGKPDFNGYDEVEKHQTVVSSQSTFSALCLIA